MSGSPISHNPFCQSNRGGLLRRLLLCLCILGISHPAIARDAIMHPDEPAIVDPWSVLDSMPADIDIAAMVENPARHLLSESGQASRSFLGSLGLMNKTKRAWSTLGELLESDADDAVETLMSGRVVLLVDSLFENSGNPLSLMSTADTNWVVMAEVDDAAFAKLRKKLKPVPREIVAGVPVYGIEQGRYALVMINGHDGGLGRVMLSPKGGRALLERSLEAVVAQAKLNKVMLVSQGPTPHWEPGRAWSLALRVRADVVLPGFESEHDRPATGSRHLRVLAGTTQTGFEVSMAIKAHGDIPLGRAPVGLLGGLGDDVVLAMASSSVMRLALDDEEGLSIFLGDAKGRPGTVLSPDGSLMVLTNDDTRLLGGGDGPVGFTVLSVFEEGRVNALTMDELIEPLVMQDDDVSDGRLFPRTSQSTPLMYNGKFPSAVRSQSVIDEDGKVTLVSWKTTERRGSSDLIFSLADDGINTGQRVRMLDRAAGLLAAVGDSDRNGTGGAPALSSVVMSGFVRVGGLLSSMPEWKLVGGGLFGDGPASATNELGLDRVRWEVVDDSGVLRGTVQFEKDAP